MKKLPGQTAGRCLICEHPIEILEPFMAAMSLGRDGKMVNVPFHVACHVGTIAGESAKLAERAARGRDYEALHYEGDTLRDTMQALVSRLIGEL